MQSKLLLIYTIGIHVACAPYSYRFFSFSFWYRNHLLLTELGMKTVHVPAILFDITYIWYQSSPWIDKFTVRIARERERENYGSSVTLYFSYLVITKETWVCLAIIFARLHSIYCPSTRPATFIADESHRRRQRRLLVIPPEMKTGRYL